jgi:hypothetical protein
VHWHAGAAKHRLAAHNFRIADDQTAGAAQMSAKQATAVVPPPRNGSQTTSRGLVSASISRIMPLSDWPNRGISCRYL